MLFHFTLYEHKNTRDLSTSNKQDSASNNGQQEVPIHVLAINRFDVADIPQTGVLVGRQDRQPRSPRQRVL